MRHYRAALIFLAFESLAIGTAAAQDAALTDNQIIEHVIKDSRDAYYATGHPCACPEDRARNGSRCGGRSAWSRPGGASPKCYSKDVTAADIAAFRAEHRR